MIYMPRSYLSYACKTEHYTLEQYALYHTAWTNFPRAIR